MYKEVNGPFVMDAQNYYKFATWHNFLAVFILLLIKWKNCITFASALTINNSSVMILNGILAFFNLGTGEIILIVAVVLLLFGGKKIPELMRGLGKGVKSFKQGMNEVEDEFKKPLDDTDKNQPSANGNSAQ